MRIIEIGGGTGGSTTHVAPLLDAENVSYTFTDISSFFVGRARERFAQHPFMNYATLDIERAPAAQHIATGIPILPSPPTSCTRPPTCGRRFATSGSCSPPVRCW